MADRGCSSTRSQYRPLASERAVVELVDALVEAVDLGRCEAVERVRVALEPFGATGLFDAELRLNGAVSAGEWCLCGGMEW